jgi:hypothetical protein
MASNFNTLYQFKFLVLENLELKKFEIESKEKNNMGSNSNEKNCNL